jgi:hypothetical protein
MMRSGVERRSCIVHSIQKPICCQENYRRISAGKGGKEAVKGIPGPGRGLGGGKTSKIKRLGAAVSSRMGRCNRIKRVVNRGLMW